MNVLLDLFLTFAYISLISFGGIGSSFPEMERQVVQVHNWMNHQTFIDLYALSLFAPGPNVSHSFLMGNQVAGLPGAIASLFGLVFPPCLLMAGVAILAGSSRPPTWIKRFCVAIRPITVGLILASAWNIGQNLSSLNIVICIAAVILMIRKWLSPSWILLLAAMLGAVSTFV